MKANETLRNATKSHGKLGNVIKWYKSQRNVITCGEKPRKAIKGYRYVTKCREMLRFAAINQNVIRSAIKPRQTHCTTRYSTEDHKILELEIPETTERHETPREAKMQQDAAKKCHVNWKIEEARETRNRANILPRCDISGITGATEVAL